MSNAILRLARCPDQYCQNFLDVTENEGETVECWGTGPISHPRRYMEIIYAMVLEDIIDEFECTQLSHGECWEDCDVCGPGPTDVSDLDLDEPTTTKPRDIPIIEIPDDGIPQTGIAIDDDDFWDGCPHGVIEGSCYKCRGEIARLDERCAHGVGRLDKCDDCWDNLLEILNAKPS